MNKELGNADPGRIMRDKIVEQLNAIIRENRQAPYQATYNFYGLGYPSGDPHQTKDAANASELVPSATTWTELSADNYQKVWSNDDVLHTKSTSTAGQYPMMLFCFKVGKKENYDLQPLKTAIKRLAISFVGYGTAAAGDGVTLQVWDAAASAWSNTATGRTSSKETINITLSASLTNYVDSNGYMYVLARTTNPSAGAATTLFCDYMQVVVDVKGLTYCDVVDYQNSDVTDVKPYLFKSEFILQGWFIETIT